MSEQLSKIGKNIRQFRIKKGLSQESLARFLNVDKAYVSRVENGRINLTINTLSKLSNALEVDIKKFLE